MNNPAPPVLILEFRRRKVSVVRSQWLTYELYGTQGALKLAQSTFSSLHNTPLENLILMTTIPGYSSHGKVEISEESWKDLRSVVSFVTIVFRQERLALEDQET